MNARRLKSWARLVLAELKHDIDREVIGSIFSITEDRHLQDVEHRVPHLVGDDIEELSEHRISWRNSLWSRLLGHGLVDLVQVLVADADRGSVIPGIRTPPQSPVLNVKSMGKQRG
jgi:hypothetical protein